MRYFTNHKNPNMALVHPVLRVSIDTLAVCDIFEIYSKSAG